jgi:hypothetical protein
MFCFRVQSFPSIAVENKDAADMRFAPRQVRNNILRSEKLPPGQFQIDLQFLYAGTTNFILYNVAHVEQHHFIITDEHKRVQRVLWFQFEGYLDDNQHQYEYSGLEDMPLQHLSFLHDADVLNLDEDYKERPTSDSAHVVEFLRAQGYRFDGDTMFKRMVWLDRNRRNELMIIYSEDLAYIGAGVADLSPGGARAADWPSISKALHERALASFKII